MSTPAPQDPALRPPTFSETGRRSSSSRNITSGRGGAGNMASNPPPPTCPTTLETPTIKASTYTTGRGGSGNMAQNACAIETRKAQDIQAHPRRESFNSRLHIGRGGGGNFVKVDESGKEGEKSKLGTSGAGESAIDDDSGEEAVEGGRRSGSPKAKTLKGKVLGALGLTK